jgi:hypothetical protein
MIDRVLYVMLLMRANPLPGYRSWASGRGLGPENLDFLGPKWHSPNG